MDGETKIRDGVIAPLGYFIFQNVEPKDEPLKSQSAEFPHNLIKDFVGDYESHPKYRISLERGDNLSYHFDYDFLSKSFLIIVMAIKPLKTMRYTKLIVTGFLIVLCISMPNYSFLSPTVAEPKVSDEADQYVLIELVKLADMEYRFEFERVNITSLDAIEIWTIYSLFNGSQYTSMYVGLGARDRTAEVWIYPYYAINLDSLSYSGEVLMYEFYSRIFLVSGRYIDTYISFVQIAFIDSEENTETTNADGEKDESPLSPPTETPSESDGNGIIIACAIAFLTLPVLLLFMRYSKPASQKEQIPIKKKNSREDIKTQLQRRNEKRKKNKRY
ncbi:MAG: hypothetical protein ACTSYI_17545 [Promethearchaeota archaeon]